VLVLGTLIAVSGKGGTGKTLISALIIRCLVEASRALGYEKRSILAIDADPDANLADALGIEIDVRRTVGYVAMEFKEMASRGALPPGIDKGSYLESKVMEVVYELEDFDLLVMWRTEGEGCYCFVNEVLSKALDWLVGGYDIVVMDCEAGLEHFNRRLFKAVDHLIIVVDGSRQSFETAKRIKEVVEEVKIGVKNMWIVGNRIPSGCEEIVYRRAEEVGIPLLGIVPLHEDIYRLYIEGKPVTELPRDHIVVKSVESMLRKLGLI